jgi:hypothetical protein
MAISFKELRDAVKALNNMEIEDLNTLRSVGVKRVILEQQFIEEVERLAPNHEDDFPDEVVNVFNALIADGETDSGDTEGEGEGEEGEGEEGEGEEGEGEDEEEGEHKGKGKGKGKGKAKGKAKGKEVKAKDKSTPKAKKESPRSRYGHIQSAMSGQLDDALFEGGTVQEIMDDLGIKRARVMSHIKHLANDLSIAIEETEGDELNDSHFKVQ